MAKEYPGTLLEFEHWFRTEESCRDYLIQLRWPEGFRCPKCASEKAWPGQRLLLMRCAGCGRNISVTAGTVFHHSHIPLRVWFRAVWWLTNQKNGVSALGLQRLMGLGSYKTAWGCLHRLRRAMVRPGRELLSGDVEVDETFLGGVRKGGKAKQNKMIVMIAAEARGEGVGRIRLGQVPTLEADDLGAFVKASVMPGSKVVTDGWPSYRPLARAGYRHAPMVLTGHGREASSVMLPRVHRVASLLRRWIMGTYQGRMTPPRLDSYLEEFAFRFNRRKSSKRGMLFYRLIQQCVAMEPGSY